MKYFWVFYFLIPFLGHSQNKQIVYDFANLPQTLLLNPGAEVTNKWHVGVPVVSHFSVNGGFTGFSTYDIFADNGVPINDKIKAAVNNFGKSEFVAFNQQLEVISAGFELPNKSYISFGYYEEFDFLAKIPKDLVDLFYQGNSIINKQYAIHKLAARSELLGVFHIGLSKKIDNKLQVGARGKIYSGVFNANSKNNSGSLYTADGTANIYSQHLENVHIKMQTSGIFLEDTEEVTSSYVQSKLLLGGNLGLGLDVGFTYHPEKQWEVTGSMLDLGFINNAQNVRSYAINGDYEVDGIQLLFDSNNPENYWENLKDDFEESIVLDTVYSKYISFRPVKLNGAVSYSFGQNYDDCRFLIDSNSYNNKIGFHLFSTLGAVHSYLAATLFFEKKLHKNIYTKFTYTVDPFSFSNLGLGLSMQLGVVNTYIAIDNLLNFSNLYDAQSASLQFGLNIIVNHKN